MTFSRSKPVVCTAGEVNGAMITLLASGTRTVRVNQPGDAIYAPDPVVSRTFGVN